MSTPLPRARSEHSTSARLTTGKNGRRNINDMRYCVDDSKLAALGYPSLLFTTPLSWTILANGLPRGVYNFQTHSALPELAASTPNLAQLWKAASCRGRTQIGSLPQAQACRAAARTTRARRLQAWVEIGSLAGDWGRWAPAVTWDKGLVETIAWYPHTHIHSHKAQSTRVRHKCTHSCTCRLQPRIS